MATSFGEVIELNSRSFVTSGEEWSFDERYSVETEKDDSKELEKLFDHLLIACGKIMSDFAAAFLISEDTQVVNKYTIVLNPSENDLFPRKKFTTVLYQLSNNTLLFVCDQLPHIYFANHLLVKLKPYIGKAGNTIILTSENISTYKPRSASQSFLRSLSTKACTLTVHASVLELPNTISGLPAAVLSWCQAKNTSAVMYIVYAESSTLDSFTAQPILHLMKASHLLNVPISTSDKLKHFVHRAQFQHSNLYE